MDLLTIFFLGMMGSLLTEVATLSQNLGGGLPRRYRMVGFWIVRLVLALVAGGLTVALGVQKPLVAVMIGAGTPLILQQLTRGVSEREPEQLVEPEDPPRERGPEGR